MNRYGIILLGFLFFICSCGKDDTIEVLPDEVGNQAPVCDSLLVLNAETAVKINYDRQSHALLYRTSCMEFNMSSPPSMDYVYSVIDVNWDSWGTGRPVRFCDIVDGLPAIMFGSQSAPEIGDVLYPVLSESLFQSTDPEVRYTIDGIVITIEETGTEVGEFIGGIVSGFVVAQNDVADRADISGVFCVPIFSVCE